VTESLLRRLDDEFYVTADVEDMPRIFLKMARQFVVVFDGDLLVEERLELIEIILLHHQDHLFDACFQRFFDDQQDGGLGNAIAVDNRKEFLLGGLAGRE